MFFIWRVIVVLMLGSAGFGLTACGAVPDRSQAANVIVVATATSNEPGAQLPAGFDQVLRDANATHQGSLAVLVPQGGRAQQVGDPIQVAVVRDGSDPENDPQLIDQGLQRISAAVANRVNPLASNEPVLDLLTGVDEAARRAARSTIVVLSSGVQTVGLADFAGLGWDFADSDVIDSLRAKGFLPDLTGKKVLFVGLGDTAGAAQVPLPQPMQAKVESLWMDICRAAGADQCVTARAGSAAPTISTVPAKVVGVPRYSLPPLPSGGGSLPVPSEALFAPDSTELLPQAQPILTALADELSAGDYGVDLVGHTWAVGPADTARDLSRDRAQAVADALVARGYPRQRIKSVSGVGYDVPIRPTGADPAATAAANRVVVVTVHANG